MATNAVQVLEREEAQLYIGGSGAAILQISVEVPEKAKIELPYVPGIPLLGLYQKDFIIYSSETWPSCLLPLFSQ